MRIFRIFWCFLAAGSFLTGCQSATGSDENDLTQFINEQGQAFTIVKTAMPDMDSLLKASVIGLTSVTKSVRLDSDSTGAEYKVTDPNSELEALAVLSQMNKPVYRNSYVELAGQDRYSNLFVRRFLSLDSAAPIRYLEISHLTSAYDIRRIKAKISRSNYLFQKHEEVVIDFDPDPFRMSRFAVIGEQKVTGCSADQYVIQLGFQYQN